MPTFSLITLGDLAMNADGHRLGEARRKPLAVLAYLAAESPRPANRDLLAGMLWPESSPDRARRTLNQTLYALRREFHEEVVIGASQLTIGPALVTSDVGTFLWAVGTGDHARAVDVYTGPFLEGVSFPGATLFEQWAEQWRARLAALHRESVLKEAARMRAAGDFLRTITVLRRGQLWYPADVEITEQLASVHMNRGAPSDALDSLHRFEQLLEREYELPLPRPLEVLRSRIMKGASDLMPPERPASAATVQTPAPAETIPSSGHEFDAVVEPPPSARSTAWCSVRALTIATTALSVFTSGWLVSRRAAATHTDNRSTPATIGELNRQYHDRRLDARLAATDSSHLGRMLILPAVNASRDPSLDTAMHSVSYSAYALEHSLLASLVPESLATRLYEEASATRLPSTTGSHIYSVMRTTRAALAVRPVLYRARHDSLRIAFEMHRDIAHTGHATQGLTPIETIFGASISGTDVNVVRASQAARQKLFAFLKSLERCDLSEHQTPDDAPWCWGEGRVLNVVPGLERWPAPRLGGARAAP